MHKSNQERINEYGSILRFITPILIGVLGFFMIRGISQIDNKLESLDLHFSNHLQHHQDLEVGYERRLSQLETVTFGKTVFERK